MATDETREKAVRDQIRRVQEILLSMEDASRPGFDDDDVMLMGVLVRLSVEFHDYVMGAPPLPEFAADPFQSLTYAIESIFSGVDSFHLLVHSYGVLVGATKTRIDWTTITAESLEGRFLSLYQEFISERRFEDKCRLLLDLFKLQIVYAGMFYDCKA